MDLEKCDAQIDEILAELNTIIPQEIKERYCKSEEWELICQTGKKITDIDVVIIRDNTKLSYKKFLAAYIINIIVCGLITELANGSKTENGDRIVSLLPMEKGKIRKTNTDLTKFVKEKLDINPWPDNDECMAPYVKIR